MKKYLLGLLVIFGLGFTSFSSAYSCDGTGASFSLDQESYFVLSYIENSTSFHLLGENYSVVYWLFLDSSSFYWLDQLNIGMVTDLLVLSPGNYTVEFSSGSSCSYSLIPVSSGEIEECPTCETTFSTLFVNGTQITGSNNIYISTPDHFEYTPTYYTGYMDLDIENVGDLDYINNILDIQSYHPDKDQFAMSFAGFLTLLMPYIIITLFIIFVWKLIRRIFR